MIRRIALALIIIVFACASYAGAHVGSPDVFLDIHAGSYHVFVTVRPPHAIPGVADVEILTADDDVREMRIVPMPLTGLGAQFAPAPDRAQRAAGSPRLFTGHLWMMSAGAWQVRVAVEGARGSGVVAVPVPTLPQSTLAMRPGLRLLLGVFMLVLAAGFVAIVSAVARDATRAPGSVPDLRARRRGRIAAAAASAVVVIVLLLGNWWWSAEASNYARYVYKPLEASSRIDGNRLELQVRDPGWIPLRRLDDFVPDHGHLMHLFILSPSLDRFWHLHPEEIETGRFEQRLPALPAGRYELFGDVVHASGVSETVVASLDAPTTAGEPLTGDDSAFEPSSDTRIVWVNRNDPIVPRQLTLFAFRVEDVGGRPVNDLELYMGMPGHAVFVRKDLKVFAHVHPSGSAPMAALEIGERGLKGAAAMPADHRMHAGASTAIPPTVTFPYGIPEPGDYRVFVQVKRAGRIVTRAFDAHVNNR